MKILLGINTLTEVNQMSYMNHLILAYRLGKDFRRHQFQLCAPRRMSIDNMRNFVAKAAIDQEFDYIWFIDDDVLIPEQSLRYLLDCKSDVAAGVTLIRGYPFHPMLFSFAEGRKEPYLDEYEFLMDKNQVVRRPDLDAVGFSCCLIKVSLLKKIPPPWFLTGPNFTEDVYFCNRAKQFKPKFTLAATGQVMTEHILGSDVIGPTTRAARMRYEEALSPGLKKKPRRAKKVKSNGKDPNAEANRLTGVRAHLFNQMYAEA